MLREFVDLCTELCHDTDPDRNKKTYSRHRDDAVTVFGTSTESFFKLVKRLARRGLGSQEVENRRVFDRQNSGGNGL